MNRLAVVLAACASSACSTPTHPGSDAPQPPRAVAPPLDLPPGGARLRVVQRGTATLDGPNGGLLVRLGDITGGQVAVTLAREAGGAILVSRSLRAGDVLTFTMDGHGYSLTVDHLENLLVGDDWADLTVRAGATGPAPLRTERERIERLLDAVARADVVFLRNGEEHDAAQAAAHLRRKWSSAGDDVRTAEAFIERIGSRSSQTGEPYRVRLPDGTLLPAREWLTERLAELDRAPN